MPKLTPMMRQYLSLKEQHPDTVLFFQLGDFYETFFEDAKLAARELDIVLTRREEVPMAGVPIKKAEVYINRLLKRGHKVAVCDQVGDPKQAKGILARQVQRVVTPGTVLDEDVLDQGTNNYLVAICQRKNIWGLAVCDVSTGEFRAASFSQEGALLAELAKLGPAELLLPQGLALSMPPELERVVKTYTRHEDFDAAGLLVHFGVAGNAGLGLSREEAQAAGGLLAYLKRTQQTLTHVQKPRPYAAQDVLRLDPFTVRNLELVRELRDGGTQATLLGVLNGAVTGMGQRLLRQWLLSPLLAREAIERRLDAVEVLCGRGLARTALREALEAIHDIERVVGRLGTGRAGPRDLLALKQSLAQLPDLWLQLKQLLDEAACDALAELAGALEALALRELAELLARALRDDAPHTVTEGGVIRADFHPELAELAALERDARNQLLALEAREREATGITTLKVGYNSVFGYFLEATKAHAKKAPPHYHRKQTLSNAERYITPELKTLEEKILAAQERARALEVQVFIQVRDAAAGHTEALQVLAQALAKLDVYAALAEVAQREGYVRPAFAEETRIEIRGGRHPVVERLVQGQAFVPNDLRLNTVQTLVVLTGPNMSGKSTYLRQIALIALMAQMGSFVSAESATLPLFDQIFTRVGASDMLAGGYSTFMVEMLETANILNNATQHSLVLLDEMGRGTSTFDGVSIAWAVAEHLARGVQAKTLFATHYHELTQLAEQQPGVVNLHVRVKEHGNDVIFLHEVAPGAAAGSYGVHVARLAGLPDRVIQEAEALLARILAANPLDHIDEAKPRRGPRVIQQLALFRVQDHPVLQALAGLDINALTPVQALAKLVEFKEQL